MTMYNTIHNKASRYRFPEELEEVVIDIEGYGKVVFDTSF